MNKGDENENEPNERRKRERKKDTLPKYKYGALGILVYSTHKLYRPK